MKFLKSLLCCCLAVWFVFAACIGVAFAASANGEAGLTAEQTEQEIISERGLYSKTFRLPDGSFRFVGYSEAVHYVDSDGSLQEIDNSVVYNAKNTGNAGYAYNNIKKSWRTYFAERLTEPNAVAITKGEAGISFGLPDMDDARDAAKMVDIGKNACRAIGGTMIYTDVLEDTDIVYTVKNGLLKEDIILKSCAAPNIYRFGIKTKGMVLCEKDRELVFL